MDTITLVAAKMSSITCKPSNLIEMINDFEDFGIPKSNIHFFLVGHETVAGAMHNNPFTLNGEKMLKIFSDKQSLPWTIELRLNCYARMFVTGLDRGRNNLSNVNKQLTEDEIIGIRYRMAIIEEEEKEDLED
ncbi:hypothetical protein DAPPUDRAFT_331476 [Daphnia pulex]|uniref:Uncharacterized protein n=1 Tax=Daphnia pulex TaxID=6669 RepID=E9HML1_DAPPU|nr:hypothetical protein DAPPUDRAFT_331476 [Daphnia pulex]|eukprot:EFX67020.1 hypothetical protein DAPPUDRAFT_331476 [Daphnia pulex]